jgi:RNA polymerase sigma-70 factor (ECF subfamily)
VESEQHERIAELYRRHADEVHAYARRRSDASVADDVVMEVFVVACRRLADVPDDALPWLLGCARRVLANQRRGSARAEALTARICAAAAGTDVDDAQAGLLAAALQQLNDADRELLLLSAWEGLELGELATVLGCSRGAAAVRLHRARRRLRRHLDPRAAAGGDPHRPEVAR